MDQLTLYAPAKVNLGLKVLRRRADGYHDILSLVQTVNICDRLTFRRVDGSDIVVECPDPEIPTGADNLVVRAARSLMTWMDMKTGFMIHLEKRIPAGAGLGGGSSDAAATLRGVNRMLGGPCDRETLHGLAAQVGSDVPFLLEGGTAVMEGRGERLRPLQAALLDLVLVFPEAAVDTPWAFQNMKIGLTDEAPYIRFLNSLPAFERLDVDRLIDSLENDFLPLVADRFPQVGAAFEAVGETSPRAASLSGTGSTVYGIYDSPANAVRAAEHLSKLGFRALVCRSLPAPLEDPEL